MPSRVVFEPYGKFQMQSDYLSARCCPTWKNVEASIEVKNSEDEPESYNDYATRTRNVRVAQMVYEGLFALL